MLNLQTATERFRKLDSRQSGIFVATIALNWLFLSLALDLFGVRGAASFFVSFSLMLGVVYLSQTELAEQYFLVSNGARRVSGREAAVLQPALADVTAALGLQGEQWKLSVVDHPTLNAFAIGRSSIIVTRGLMSSADPAELRAVLAHELGHHANGDTALLAALYVINICGQVAVWIMMAAAAVVTWLGNYSGLLRFAGLCLLAILWLIAAPGKLALALVFHAIGRQQEHKADMFAVQAGYGAAMCSFLDKIQPMEGVPQNFLMRLAASHPSTELRIDEIEKALNA